MLCLEANRQGSTEIFREGLDERLGRNRPDRALFVPAQGAFHHPEARFLLVRQLNRY